MADRVISLFDFKKFKCYVFRELNLFLNFINYIYLCQKELISRIKNEPKQNMVLEKGCQLKMGAMLLKEEKSRAGKN